MKRENMTKKKKMDGKGKPPQCLILSRREFFCKKAFFLLNRIFRFISFISQLKDAMLRECVGTLYKAFYICKSCFKTMIDSLHLIYDYGWLEHKTVKNSYSFVASVGSE
jgi:hypothetical protein